MYITDKYWENYIGGTDDSLTLVEYLAGKQKTELQFGEICSDFGIEKLQGDFRKPDISLSFVDAKGWEIDICCAINLITDLAALLLECKVNGSIDMRELDIDETDAPQSICITAERSEHEMINQALKDFAAAPLTYDLSEMVPKEEMLEMAALCEELRKELYGGLV